ncbi:MAG: preprotein translocase subunit SecG [Paracoccaceae bacterium]
MENVILTIHLILAVSLIGAVLLQRSEGGGLGIGGGGGGIMSGRGAATALSKVTWALAIAFIATSLTLTIVAARKQAGESVIETLGTETGQTQDSDLPPALKDNLIPPVDPGAPATPPPVE